MQEQFSKKVGGLGGFLDFLDFLDFLLAAETLLESVLEADRDKEKVSAQHAPKGESDKDDS
jgi:hypothetical protein